ncbi:MAG: T9SS type A sorting domain-containing protein, partial [Candidatus Neomarinimicrobiota bacterium]
LMVTDSSTDATGVNEITITRDSRNKKGYTVKKVLDEGGHWTIGGVHKVLNGGRIYFPQGSVPTDIRLHISIPKFAEDKDDSVRYKHKGMVGGVDFQVMVNDTLMEPYQFGTPLIVGLVFKRGLLKNLGIDPATLGLYFATADGDSVLLDTTGIGNTIVDLHRNRIWSSVAHFSSLAIVGVENSAVDLGTASYEEPVPTGFALAQNYPNPFNPVTTIDFKLPITTQVILLVYDILGRQVSELINAPQAAGYHSVVWNGKDGSGRELPTGIYIARLITPEYAKSIKMVLLK